MKIKFDSGDYLLLNKRIEIPIMTIVVRALFHKITNINNKFFRWMCVWNTKVLYYGRTDVSEGIDVNK